VREGRGGGERGREIKIERTRVGLGRVREGIESERYEREEWECERGMREWRLSEIKHKELGGKTVREESDGRE